MATTSRQLDLVLTLKDQATKQMKGFSGALNKASSSVFNMQNALLGLTGGVGIGFLGKMALQTAGDFETARSALIGLLGSVEEADKTMARIKKEAAATPFELTGLTEGVKQLASVVDTGDEAIDILMTFGKAVTASGGGNVELDRVVANLKQIKGMGKLEMVDLKELRRAIPMFDQIIEASGTTIDQIRDAKDPAEALFDAFEKGSKKIEAVDKAFSIQAGNFNQLVSNMKDVFVITMGEIATESGAFDIAKDAMSKMIDFLTNHKDDIVNFAINSIESLKKFAIKLIELKNVFINIKNFIVEHKESLKALAIVITAIILPALAQYIFLVGTGYVVAIGQSIIATGKWIIQGWAFVARVQLMATNLIFLIYELSINFVFALKKGVINMVLWLKKSALMIASFIKQTIQLGIAIAQYLILNATMLAGAVASGVLTAATWLLNVALLVLTSPITLVILAIAALIAIGVLLWKNWDWIKEKAIEVWGIVKQVFMDTWSKIASFFGSVWEGMKGIFKSSINYIISGINKVIRAANKIKIPEWAGGDGEALLNVPEIPMLANGGVVTKPTLAMVGEGGESEAVVPLSKAGQMGFGGGGQVINITFKDSIVTSRRDLEDMIDDIFRKKQNLAV